MTTPHGIVDSEALRVYLHSLWIVPPLSFARWMRSNNVEPVGFERRGRSTVALWDLRGIPELVERLDKTR